MTTKKNQNPNDILNQYLENQGLRKTPERSIILDEIYNTDGHFDIDELINLISKK